MHLNFFCIVSFLCVHNNGIFFNFLFCIGIELIKNVAIVLGEQQRDSVHIYVSIPPETPPPLWIFFKSKKLKKKISLVVPGVIGTPSFHCQGPRFYPWSGN